MLRIERRQFLRVPFTETVEYFVWNERKSALACEIGPEGVALRAAEVLPEGTLLTMRIRLPGAMRGFTVLGQIAHQISSGTGVGVQFVDIAPSDRDQILAYITRRARMAA